MKRNFLLVTALFLLAFLSLSKPASATEGVVDLYSLTGTDARCHALSIFSTDNQFHLLVSCRDLVYPPDTYILHYLLWATPQKGGDPLKLGELSFGKMGAKTAAPFTELYVTQESNPKVKEPTGDIILKGQVQPIQNLVQKTTPTPTPTPTEEEAEALKQAPETEKENRLKTLLRGMTFLPIFGIVFIILFILFLVRRK